MNRRRVGHGLLRFCVLCAACGYPAGSAFAEEAPPKEAAALVEQLRHSDYDVRNAAREKLAALGEAARTVLEGATRAEDVETRAAATALLNKLETATVTLLAFDRDGRPAAGAEAEVRPQLQRPGGAGNEQNLQNITVGADGTARLASLAPQYANFNFAWKKWTPTRDGSPWWSVNLERGSNPLFVTLARDGAVEVSVQDAQGAPLKDGRAQLFNNMVFNRELLDLQLAGLESWGARNTPTGACDAKGVAKVDAGEGLYQCVVLADGYLPALAGAGVRVREGETTRLGSVKLVKKNNGQVRITLQKADGSAAKEARINLSLEYQYEGPEGPNVRREALALRAQMNMRRSPDQRQLDDKGKLLVEDLRPGKYRLVAAMGNDAPWHMPEVVVTAGQTTELPPLKPAQVGSVKGKLTGQGGKGLGYCTVNALPEQDLSEDAGWSSPQDWRFVQRRNWGMSNSSTQSDGAYELRNLLPGKYVVTIATRRGQAILICGVEVTAGKTTAVADTVVPSRGGVSGQAIKGVVLLPDGKPAANASVNLYHSGSSWGRNCDEKGQFEYSSEDQAEGYERLIVKVPGCRPLCLELNAPGLKLDTLTLRLQKQEYGALSVKVADEAGKPLKGVAVWPGGRYRTQYFQGMPQERQAVTNKNGEVRFTGLAVGERMLNFDCSGYYLPGEFKAVVVADTEAQVKAVLRAGMKVCGRLELPEGKAYGQAVASLSGGTSRVSWVKDDGSFAFAGLPPGEYWLSASAPGLAPTDHAMVTLRPDAPPPELRVKLARPGGAAVMLGQRLEGYAASLMPKGSWDPLVKGKQKDRQPGSLYATVDAAGRAEFWGAMPGDYDVLASPNTNRMQQYYPGYYRSGNPRKAPVSAVVGPVQVQALKSVSELHELQAQAFTIVPGTATVTGKLTPVGETPPTITDDNICGLNLRLVGSAAMGNITLSYPGDFRPQAERQPIIIGTPPRGVAPAPFEPGCFTFQDVPPGEYKLLVDLARYRHAPRRPVWSPESEKPAPTVLATITVRAGEKADVGDVKYELPQDLLSDTAGDWHSNRWQMEIEPEDQIPVFQP